MSSDQINAGEPLPVTFMADDGSIVINFGILCGREATQAEIDRLAQALNDQAGAGPDITIVASRRQDYGQGIETVTHQVTVEATGVLSRCPRPSAARGSRAVPPSVASSRSASAY